MKRILFILLLIIPFVGFGQSTYQINRGEEPISEKCWDEKGKEIDCE